MPTHKRRVLSEDEDDDFPPVASKISKKASLLGHERFSSEEHSEPGASGFSSSNHDEVGTITKRTKRDRDDMPTRSTTKRRRVLDEDGDEEEDEFATGLPDDFEDEDEYLDEDEVGKKGKKKAGTKARVPAKAKNERGKKSGTDNVSSRQRAAKPKTKASGDEDMHVDVVKDSHSSNSRPASPAQVKPAAAPPPAKKKLPTIRKIKTGASDASSPSNRSTPTATTPQQSLHLNSAPLRKLPHENPDINLNDSAVYNDLFKAIGNPRNSASKAKEDKKRELYRMRDEAKAKRLAETRPTFDLQSQSDKIASFEARLRTQRSGALYPNCLAAKWKENFERSMLVRQQAAAEADREEGEVAR